MKKLKATIKELSEQQPSLKQQRKSVYFTGERTMSPTRARTIHLDNRLELRLLYALIGLNKGLTLAEIEPKNKPSTLPLSYYQRKLDKLKLEYAE